MRMTLASLALAMLVNVAAYGQTDAIAPDWVFISTPLKWQSPPPNAELHIRTTPATLLVVYPSGKYAAVSCLLIQQKDGAVTISHGDGYVVRSSTWKMVSDKLSANASVVFRTVSRIGNTEPEPSQNEQFKIERKRPN